MKSNISVPMFCIIKFKIAGMRCPKKRFKFKPKKYKCFYREQLLVFVKYLIFKIDELRQNILEVVFHYAPGPRIVLTRVCVALSALVIHLVTDYWETAVSDIIETLRGVEV